MVHENEINFLWKYSQVKFSYFWDAHIVTGMVGWGKGVVYLASLDLPTDIGLQLGKVCYPYSR